MPEEVNGDYSLQFIVYNSSGKQIRKYVHIMPIMHEWSDNNCSKDKIAWDDESMNKYMSNAIQINDATLSPTW